MLPEAASMTPQFSAFKDCVARRLFSGPGDSTSGDASALDDFTAYLAAEAWPALPEPYQSATYETKDELPEPDELFLNGVPVAFTDTLLSCGLADDEDGALALLRKVLADYVSEACSPPPVWSRTRTTECEICERQVPLTYHHLIPREVHARVLKKKWHPESMLNSVAWLCRPCHSTVHHIASNEELARDYYTVDLLLQREDIQKWRKYASKQRRGVRRG